MKRIILSAVFISFIIIFYFTTANASSYGQTRFENMFINDDYSNLKENSALENNQKGVIFSNPLLQSDRATKTPRPTSTPVPIPPPPEPMSLNLMILFGIIAVIVVLIGVWINRKRPITPEGN